jgi:hypothetical protein
MTLTLFFFGNALLILVSLRDAIVCVTDMSLSRSRVQNTKLHLYQPQHYTTVTARRTMNTKRITTIQKLIRTKKSRVALDMVDFVFREVIVGTTLPLR